MLPWNADLSGNWSGTSGIPSNQVTLDQGFAGLGASGGCTIAERDVRSRRLFLGRPDTPDGPELPSRRVQPVEPL